MRIGILACFYNCADSLDEVIFPWTKGNGKDDFIISAVSCKFKEYEDLDINQNNFPTIKKLTEYIHNNYIQFLEVSDKPLVEHDARNLALNHILKSNCDIIWLLDGDEFYNEQQIEKILSYINREDNQFYYWYSIPFKNYILDGKQWVSGFCPPRIFKIKIQNNILNRFYWDNDLVYLNQTSTSACEIDYKHFPNRSIPLNQINNGIRHMTWLDNDISHAKILYQQKHFGGLCSYKWEDGHLKIDEDYYIKTGQGLPIIYKDE